MLAAIAFRRFAAADFVGLHALRAACSVHFGRGRHAGAGDSLRQIIFLSIFVPIVLSRPLCSADSGALRAVPPALGLLLAWCFL